MIQVRTGARAIVLVSACLVLLAACGGAASSTAATTAPAPNPPAKAATAVPSAAPTSTQAAAATADPALAAFGALCEPTRVKFDPKLIDLTGAWAGDDGGTYYVRQTGKVVWWNGMSDRLEAPEYLGRAWNNVGRGELGPDLTINAAWADVPRGGTQGLGTIDLKVGPDSEGNLQINVEIVTGDGRGDSVWKPCTPGFPVS
ncbi:MAG TPA: hypothetical protein VID95_11705 [Candidatus Limnocylindrales bacterium]